jgi:peptidoglycan/LPS O-acetylase OafA/YrhL
MGAVPGGLVGRASGGIVKFPELYGATNFGWVGVEIFFVISGFVIAFSGEKSTAFSFFRSRIVRLGPAVWICAPVTLVATMFSGFRSNEIMYRAFRHSMAFLPVDPWIDGSYWTLGIEMMFYTAVFVLIKFFKFERIRLLAVLVGCVSTLFWTANFIPAITGTSSFALQLNWLLDDRLSKLLLIHHGMFFSLGVFLWAELIKKHDTRNIFWIVLFCIAGCAQIIAETRHGNSD